MKKVPKRLLVAVLLMTLLLSGCCVQEENTTVSPEVVAREPIPQGEISLRETDQLVSWSFMDLPYFVELYEEKYPEIQVENVVMDVNAYQKKLYEGFEEGETPDIIFLQPDLFFQKDDGETGYYEDIQQLFDSGKLLNLKRLVEEDAGFEGTECLEAAFAACEYRGGLYGIPASLDGRNFLLSGEETLKRVGYEAEQVEDAASLFRELVRVRPRAREQEGFVSMLDFPGEKKLECLFRASQVPLIDYESGTVLPEGEQGELVVTTLSRVAMPVLRYRTKDITSITYEPCKCGRTHARMAKTAGRTDDMLIIKGVNVFPTQIESVLVGTPNIGPHYQIVVRRVNFKDTLEIRVELINADLLDHYRELEALQRNLHDRLKSVLGLEAKVTLVQPKTLERFQGKAKRILDLRNQPETKQ